MKSAQFIAILIIFVSVALFVTGCTTTTTIGNPAPAQTVMPAQAAAAAPAAGVTIARTAGPVAAQAIPACPDREVLTGSWDSREVGYASNHDVRDPGVWADAGPVPVTLAQKCRDVTGTYRSGDCPGTLTGKIEQNVFSGKYTLDCANSAESSSGTFSVTMAADNQSFMGSMYKTGAYGPESGFPPSWWAKKTT